MKSKQASYQGRIVDVVEVKGGWSTVLDGMKQLEVRNSELSAPIDGKPNVPGKPSKVRSAKDKVAKPAKAKREPKPKADGVVRMVNPDLTRYTTHGEVKTPSGRKAIDINDEVATSLRGADLSEVYRVASGHTGVTQKALRERYEHLNPGMQRMNLGNLVRGAIAATAREEAKAAKSPKQ